VCEQHGDSVTANVLEEILDETERRKWFLFEITCDTNATR
jgi:starvation-inducible DNA-binding protein